MRKSLVLVALLVASPSFAGPPEKGEGTITLLGGIRTVLPSNADYLSDQPGATHQPVTPAAIASFGYQFDDDLHFKIELGYLSDHYKIPGPVGDLSVRSIPILLGLDTVILKSERFTFYGGGGIGYLLNTGSRGGNDNEANSTVFYGALGLRFQLGGIAALVLEDRYILASAAVDPQDLNRSLTVGGNLLLAGIMFHFHEADDHPMHP